MGNVKNMNLYSDKLKPTDLLQIDRQIRSAKVPGGNVLAILQIFCLVWLWQRASMLIRDVDKKVVPEQLVKGREIIERVKKSCAGLAIKAACESVGSFLNAQNYTWVVDPISGKLDNVRSAEAIAYNKADDCDGSACLIEALIPGAQTWCLQNWVDGWYNSGHVISVVPDGGKYHVFSNFKLVQIDAGDLKKIFKKQFSGADWAVRVELTTITIKEIIKM